MARRHGWATGMLGLHACILAGCLHTDSPGVGPVAPQNPPANDMATGGNPSRSPYTARVAQVPLPEKSAESNLTTTAAQAKPPAPINDVKAAPPADLSEGRPSQPAPPASPPLLTDPVFTKAAQEAPESPLLVALRYVLAKKPAEAFDALQSCDKRTQDLLLALLPLAARLSEGGLDQASPQEIGALIDQLNTMSNLLRGRTALTIEKACFARRIEGFGVYDPMPANPVFLPAADGQHSDRAPVYAEVRNFLSQYDGKSFEIHLTGRLEVYTADGQFVWGHNYRDGPAASQSARQDFYVSFRFSPPPTLRPGNYILVVEVHDENVPTTDSLPRVARCKLPFRIGELTPSRSSER